MKILLNILIATLLLFAISCNRKVASVISRKTIEQDSSSKAIDTSKKVFKEHKKETTFFGDTVKSKMVIGVFTNKKDTTKKSVAGFTLLPFNIQTNGINVNGKFTEKQDGTGYDLDLEAIAKPKEKTTETNTETAEQKGVDINTNTHNKIDDKEKGKAVEVTNEVSKWIAISIIGLGLLVLSGFIIYLFIDKKRNGTN
jgi:hypothetical protein